METILVIISSSMNESQESTVFGGRQKLNSAMEQARKVVVHFKFDGKSSYTEVGLVKKLDHLEYTSPTDEEIFRTFNCACSFVTLCNDHNDFFPPGYFSDITSSFTFAL